jgi:hypothetical protein
MVSSHFNDEGNILRAHALDLYLVFANRTHFEQSVEEFVNSPNSTSENSEPANMHAHWVRCCQLTLLMLHFKLLDEKRTWMTSSS